MAGLLDPRGKLVDTEEAAELLRLSKRTLEDKRVDGTGPAFYKLGHGKRARRPPLSRHGHDGVRVRYRPSRNARTTAL